MIEPVYDHLYPSREGPWLVYGIIVVGLLVFSFPIAMVMLENDNLGDSFKEISLTMYGILLILITLQGVIYFTARRFCTRPQYYSNLVHYLMTHASIGGFLAWFNASSSAAVGDSTWIASLVLGCVNSLFILIIMIGYLSRSLFPSCCAHLRCRCPGKGSSGVVESMTAIGVTGSASSMRPVYLAGQKAN